MGALENFSRENLSRVNRLVKLSGLFRKPTNYGALKTRSALTPRRTYLSRSIATLGLILAFVPVSFAANIPGLGNTSLAITDEEGVPHLVARTDLDLARVQGYVHARDRFFQMDLIRRQASGTLSELFGSGSINSDVTNRMLGLRLAAERSVDVISAEHLENLEAYAEGVNAFLAEGVIPPEYTALELSQLSPWTVVDSLVILKAVAANLSLTLDTGSTQLIQAYMQAGAAQGFDGQALYFEDIQRIAPVSPIATAEDPFFAKSDNASVNQHAVDKFVGKLGDHPQELLDSHQSSPLLTAALERDAFITGSNVWVYSGEFTRSGKPIFANDPHLGVGQPSTFYEWHLTVPNDPVNGRLNASGMSFPGVPGLVHGQNDHITWGSTTNLMDVSDMFLDTLVSGDPVCAEQHGSPLCIISEGEYHPVSIRSESYQVNVLGDGVVDNLEDSGLPSGATMVLSIPFRSYGPVLSVTDPTVLTAGGTTSIVTLQYTGFHGTTEASAFLHFLRVKNLDEFKEAISYFDVGSQNWTYLDVKGNIASFTSAELPLRKDLEAGVVAGMPPTFIRDGSGANNWVADPDKSQGQHIPYAILPAEEMPHVINPEQGYLINTNNDPSGATFDNDAFNQMRVGKPGAIFYMNNVYDAGFRMGRANQLVNDAIQSRAKVTMAKVKEQQLNNQQYDAELLIPHLVEAYDSIPTDSAPAALVALLAAPNLSEAIDRLRAWDFSTPTGIPEGYDANDKNGVRGEVSEAELNASVAATIYNVWRAKLIKATVDQTMVSVQLPAPSSTAAIKALFNLVQAQPFTGLGASGLDFFAVDETLGLVTAEERKQWHLLASLAQALESLASEDFINAYGGSQSLVDYQWGKLHRITLLHPLGPTFSVPSAGGFENLSDTLPGLARDGGYGVLNASPYSARADKENEFTFAAGPARRYVGTIERFWGRKRIRGFNTYPGGPKADPTSSLVATQLGDWLTGDYHRVNMFALLAFWNAERIDILRP